MQTTKIWLYFFPYREPSAFGCCFSEGLGVWLSQIGAAQQHLLCVTSSALLMQAAPRRASPILSSEPRESSSRVKTPKHDTGHSSFPELSAWEVTDKLYFS